MKDYTEELLELTDKKTGLSKKYMENRYEYGQAKAKIDFLYAGKILKLLEKKKNLGYETGLLLLISEDETAKDLYKEMIQRYNQYKAVEKLIEAHDSRIMAIQSIMKYNRQNDGGI